MTSPSSPGVWRGGRATNLRVNDVVCPVGTPDSIYFGWHLSHPQANQLQTGVQILVASRQDILDADNGDLWDSGFIATRSQNHVAYSGTALSYNSKYFWKVRYWDSAGQVSAYSECATFQVGLLHHADWAGAKWVKRDSADADDYTYFRKTFVLPSLEISHATVYISAVHKYELFLNGTAIGTGPAYHYPQYQYYNAYDITTSLTPGPANTFAVFTHWFGAGQGRPESARGLILKAIIEYADGTIQSIGTDATWKQARAKAWMTGQPSRNHEGVGYVERIDATKLLPNWYAQAYDDSAWAHATEIGAHPTPPWTGALHPDLSRIVEHTIAPLSIQTLPTPSVISSVDHPERSVEWGSTPAQSKGVAARNPTPSSVISSADHPERSVEWGSTPAQSKGVATRNPTLSSVISSGARNLNPVDPNTSPITLIDLGQVYAGRPRIEFSGGQAGQCIELRGGYTLAADGTIDPRTWQDTDMTYYAHASGSPFTFMPYEYLGMRYIQIENTPSPISNTAVSFVVRHSALDESRSSFTSSNPTLDAAWDLCKRSVTLGAQEQFLDTPTREKGGFLVDSMNASLAAMMGFGERVLTRRVLHEFLQSMEQYWSSQADRGRMNAVYPNGDGARDIPDFTQAYLVWVWEYYLQTGDTAFLADNYTALKSIAAYVHRYHNRETGLIHRLRGGGGAYLHGIVDWPPSMRYGYDMECDARTVVNCYAYADYDSVSRIAAVLCKDADAALYRQRAEELKSAINSRLLNADNLYTDGLHQNGASPHMSQHANMFPLALGIVPPNKRAHVLKHVKELKMSVGMVTVYWLVRALGELGEGQHLFELYTNAAWDGWAKCLAKGATCTWESWDADKGGNLSMSHPWGAVGLCGIQQYILGIKPLAPQYEWVEIKPLDFGDKLTFAKGRVPTERGDIFVSWERGAGRFGLELGLPVNMQARVGLPCGEMGAARLFADGQLVEGNRDGDYIRVENVGSGEHRYELVIF